MCCRSVVFGLLAAGSLTFVGRAAPVIDPISNVTIPAGKSLIVPINATSPGGQPLTFTATSNTNRISVVMHTNSNPFWQLTVAQAAASNAPGAYLAPYRGGLVSVTNVGAMTFMLFPEYAPHAVNVNRGLTTAGFYNSNTIFHRVVTNFVIQGGDPLTNGSGGLTFVYDDEFDPTAIFTGNGQLALANARKDANNCQFFVTVGPQRSLDFRYVLFGQMVRGFNILTNINQTPVDANSRPLADEIIQIASYVTNTADTVLTLTATNVSGITGKITVIADAGTGGRTTNTFNATTVNDTNSNGNPLIYPNTITNLVSPVNKNLTNLVHSVGLDGEQLFWFPAFADEQSLDALNGLGSNYSNNIFRTLTYNVTNQTGLLQSYLVPSNNYVGPVHLFFDVSSDSQWDIYQEFGLPLPPYDEQLVTFVFGDTPINGQSNSVTVVAGKTFSSALMATFTNGVPGSAASNFAALINWGDNVLTLASISTNGAGQKVVSGGHTYLYPGVYPVYVTVQSAIGASATILSRVTAVANVPSLALGTSPVLGPNGFSFSLKNAAGLSGSIQVSTNLQNWTIFTNFNATNSTIAYLDRVATNSTRRFYRTVIP